MKKILLPGLVSFLFANIAFAQNIGIGTSTPVEKLDVNGAIRIGHTVNNVAGAIRWNQNQNDFEGYNGSSWLSFTKPATWGTVPSFETGSSDLLLNHHWSMPSNMAGKALGNSLSLSGNYLLAGAPRDYAQDDKPESGTVRLFKKLNNEWKYYYELKGVTPVEWVQFGYSTAMSGNYIICGAPGYAINGVENQGRAFIYRFYDNGSAPYASIQMALQGLPETSGSTFGHSVAITDNYAVVGAPGYGTGKVYVFKRSGDVWSLMSTLIAPDLNSADFFGNSVSISGQYIAIGAHRANTAGLFNKGKVALYKLNASANGWDHVTSIWPNDSYTQTFFGKSVHLQGDTLVVGAHAYSTGPVMGRVYVYVRNGNEWSLQSSFTSPGVKSADSFGASVYYNDGRIIVGAPTATALNISQGKAYIFKYDGVVWQCEATLVSMDGKTNDLFGNAVLLDGNKAIVSAPQADVLVSSEFRTDNGRVYFFDR